MPDSLITGGTGFIGHHLALHLSDKGHDVTICDNLFRGKMDSSIKELLERKNVKYIKCDMTNTDDLAQLDSYDYVYHLAAINGTRHFYEIPHTVLRVNILGVINLLDWFAEEKKGKVLFTSSSETYAGTVMRFGAAVPTNEDVALSIDDIYNPRWSYGSSKIAGESLFVNYARHYKFPMTIVRYHNIYGPRMGTEHVIPEFILRAARREDPFCIKGGSETRAFCYVDDAVRATVLCMENAAANGRIFNAGNDAEEISIIDLAKKIFSLVRFEPELDIRPAPEGSVPRRCPDIARIKGLGYTPQVSLVQGLKKTIEWYAEHAI